MRGGNNWRRTPEAFAEGPIMTWYSTPDALHHSEIPITADTEEEVEGPTRKVQEDFPSWIAHWLRDLQDSMTPVVYPKHTCGLVPERETEIESVPTVLWTLGDCYSTINIEGMFPACFTPQ